MQPDYEYMRNLLFKIEIGDDPIIAVVFRTLVMTAEREKHNFHIELLRDENLLELRSGSDSSYRLTNEGHNFIKLIRDDAYWNKIKSVGGGCLASMIAAAKRGV